VVTTFCMFLKDVCARIFLVNNYRGLGSSFQIALAINEPIK